MLYPTLTASSAGLRFAFLASLASTVSAHMNLLRPPPLNHPTNPFNTGPPEEHYTFPLDPSGSDFPCRGYLSLLGTPAAKSVQSYTAGQSYAFQLEGSSPHYGGSSQIGLSYDQGKSFRVIKSFPGSCPHRLITDEQIFNFNIPADAPSGEAIFFWMWHNREKESYMNCAVVTVENEKLQGEEARKQALSGYPFMLEANIGNGCSTPFNSIEVEFPVYGDQVERGDEEYPLGLPEGSCAKGDIGEKVKLDGGDTPKPEPTTTSSAPPPPPSAFPPPSNSTETNAGGGNGEKTVFITITKTIEDTESYSKTMTLTKTAVVEITATDASDLPEITGGPGEEEKPEEGEEGDNEDTQGDGQDGPEGKKPCPKKTRGA